MTGGSKIPWTSPVGEVVLDASAMVELLVGDGGRADEVARHLLACDHWIVPPIFDLECLAALRRSGGAAPSRVALMGLSEVLHRSPLERVPTHPLTPRIVELLGSITAFDAAYVVLAEALDLPLLTCDARLTRVTGPRCTFALI